MNKLHRGLGLALAFALCAACSSSAIDADTGIGTEDIVAADAVAADRAAAPDSAPDLDVAPAMDAATGDDVPAGTDVTPGNDAAPATDAPVLPAADYTVAGPLAPRSLARVMYTVPTSTGCAGNRCQVAIDVTLPTAPVGDRAAPYPLVVFTNGFQLTDDQYASYAARLASWGYVVLRWNTTGETLFSTLAHDVLGRMAVRLIDWAAAENTRAGSALMGLVATDHVLAVGHSRGGKVSVLAALDDARIAAVVGIDPVNSMGVNAVAALRASARPIPLAVIGSGLGGMTMFGMACAPVDANYAQFYGAAMSPAFEAVVLQAGHMQFLDSRATCGLTCAACANGSAMDAEVRSFTQTVTVAWAERFLRGVDTSRYTEGDWIAAQVARMFVTSLHE